MFAHLFVWPTTQKKGAGKDASDMFDDVGHSGAAIEYLKDFYIGQLAKEE
jgi:cytochrome b involved in lipid metabolism